MQYELKWKAFELALRFQLVCEDCGLGARGTTLPRTQRVKLHLRLESSAPWTDRIDVIQKGTFSPSLAMFRAAPIHQTAMARMGWQIAGALPLLLEYVVLNLRGDSKRMVQ